MRRLVALLLAAACARSPAAAPEPSPEPVWFLPSAGCTDSVGRALPSERATDTLSAAFSRQRPDAANAYAARRLPGGYASGSYPTAGGRGIMWLRDTTLRDSILARLPAMPGLSFVALPPDSVEVRQVAWDGAALYDWMWYIVRNIPTGATKGVNGYGIDRRNRVLLSVVSRADVGPLLERLDRLGVPCQLVVFEVIGEISIISG